MKKLYISVPMKGRTVEEIKATIQKMKKLAEKYEGEELELIDSYIEGNSLRHNREAVCHLGENLKKLAMADVFIGIQNVDKWGECYIEREVALRYGIKIYIAPERNMKLRDLINVIDSNTELNILNENRRWLFMDKAVFISSDLLERTVKDLSICRDELVIILED